MSNNESSTTRQPTVNEPVGRASQDKSRHPSGQRFAGIQDYKRNPENDRAADRRASLSDQSAKPGVLGGVWNSVMKDTRSK